MRRFVPALLLGLLMAGPAGAQDTRSVPYGGWKQLMINSPPCLTPREAWEGGNQECTAADYDAWLADIRHWRQERRIRIGYDAARYDDPRLAWTRTSFVQTQMMVEDRYFYDPVAGRYTVDRYLDDLTARFGGIDAVLLWPDYPNMGIDDRNQLDQVANLPGGLTAVKAMVADFHRRGVRVLLPMMMWDQGTRAPARPWPQAIADLAREIGIDGINGDTQDGVPLAFSLAADKAGHPLAFQPEGVMADEAVAWDLMSWGQYTFTPVPKVDRYKWLETRHMVNISDRWARDKTDDLHYAFFNGVGWEAWENVWGIWNGISPRDGEAMRRVATLERGLAPLLSSPDWQPFYPTLANGVFASRWPGTDGRVAWTLINRNDHALDQAVLAVPAQPALRYFDLYHGVELTPRRQGDQLLLAFPLEAQGFGAVLALPGAPDSATAALMERMKAMTAVDLAGLPRGWAPLPQRLVDIPATAPAAKAPPGMVEIPAGDFTFRVQGLEIEGGTAAGVDVAYPWEDSPRRHHDHRLSLPRFFIDRFPVTNAAFKRFLDASGYHPRDDRDFLKDWKGATYPVGWDNRPVTWVSQEDARAYAAWAGKRLPHEWEWQYAAQGLDGRRYPWGDVWRDDAVPVPERGRLSPPPEPVGAHPAGASPFGVQDLVGTVWQWTDEYQDEHTRAAILRGGSPYQPQGSIWYFPQAYRNDQHGKLLLMAPSRDRSALVGFRCVQDAG